MAAGWKERIAALRSHRAYGALLLGSGLLLPVLFLLALVVAVVTFSWSISAEFARTWGLVSGVVVLIVVGALLAAAGRLQRYPRRVRRLLHRAEAGQAEAMAELARCYEGGEAGLPRDRTQAAGWWRRLAEGGDPEGAYRWGSCLASGDGVLRDSAKGEVWLRRAAEAGHPAAQARLQPR